MKRLLCNFSIVLLLISCTESKHNSFTLNGDIKGNFDSYIYLKYEDKIDSALVADSHFQFKGSVSHPTESILYPASPNSKEQMGITTFMLENSNIDIILQSGSRGHDDTEIKILDMDSISGSKTHLAKTEFEEELLNSFHKEEDSIKAISLFPILDKFVSNNPESELSGKFVAALNGYYGFLNADQLEMLLNKMDTLYQTKKDLTIIKSMISRKRMLAPGKKPPYLELPDSGGKLINSRKFKGKIVLLEFWASWCAPCRRANPELLNIYNEFSREEFEIIGISIDKDAQAWQRAIQEDDLVWPQTIDTSRIIAEKYHFKTIPFNILLDRDGKIIATELKPDELRRAINSKI